MQGFSETLWPIRYKPFEDELLSCWLVRLAHGHGLKVQTFCNLLFGNRLQVWNRDIDRLAPTWLLEELIARTGTPRARAERTTLRVFEGVLYPQFKESGNLFWMLAAQVYHRQRKGYAQQFCARCLAEDEVPYFRKTWRVALKTVCLRHQCMLWDRCPKCEVGVAFHRMDMGRPYVPENGALAACFRCGFNLATAPAQPIQLLDKPAFDLLAVLVSSLDAVSVDPSASFPADRVVVLRHLVRLMLSARPTVGLRGFVADGLGVEDLVIGPGKRLAIESLPTATRHVLLQFGAWVLVNPEAHLRQAWKSRAIRYNHLLREFEAAPAWYTGIAEQFSEWRDRLA
jgi:hypothetical protein